MDKSNVPKLPDIQLVVLTGAVEPVHADSHHAAAERVSDAQLESMIIEALKCWPTILESEMDLVAADHERLPEFGITITYEGRLLAEPGCCSGLSTAVTLCEFIQSPIEGTHTLFTGHDVIKFVRLRFDQETEHHIDILISDRGGEDTSFSMSIDQANDLAAEITTKVENICQRVANVLRAQISTDNREAIAQYLVGVDLEKYW